MKVSVGFSILLTLVGTLGLLAFAFLPALHAVAPEFPALVQVDGTQTLKLDGGSIRYQSKGEGNEALLFLHGFNSQLSIWNGTWEHLGDCARSVRLDIAGYGGSRWDADSYALPEQAERVVSFMNSLGLSKVTLVGVSMGASLSAWIAAHYPDRVKGLVLMAPSGYPGSLHYGGRFGKLLESGVLNQVAGLVAGSGLYRRLYPESAALQALSVTASYGKPWAEALGKIGVPTWILWSRGDQAVPFTYAQAVTNGIVGSRLVPLAQSVGHDIPAARAELIAEIACKAHSGQAPLLAREVAGASL